MKWVALAIFGSVGLIAFVTGCAWGYQRLMLYLDGVSAQGTVVENRQSRSKDSDGNVSDSYYPVVEFVAKEGSKHRFTGSTGSSVADYEPGAKVSVRYDPKNPSSAQITDFAQFWLGPLGVGVFGFFFLLAGIGSFILIKGSDETFGPEFHRKIDQVSLSLGGQGIRLEGQVDSVRKQTGKSGDEYVVVCRAALPGGISQQKFEAAPIFFNPGAWIVGKSVEIYIDPHKKDRYAVMLDPLLASLSKGDER